MAIDYKQKWEEEEKMIGSIKEYDTYYTFDNHLNPNQRRLEDIFQEAVLIYLIPNKAKLLDVGCSYGRVMRLFPNSYGVDVSDGMLKRNPFKDRIKQMDASKKFTFEDESFEVVLFSKILNHLQDEDIVNVLNEGNRVLEKDGYILADISKKINKIWFLKKIYWRINNKKSIASRCLSIRKIKGVLNKLNFKYKIHEVSSTMVMFKIFRRKNGNE